MCQVLKLSASEIILTFFPCGLLFVATKPPCLLANILMYIIVITRLLQDHTSPGQAFQCCHEKVQ